MEKMIELDTMFVKWADKPNETTVKISKSSLEEQLKEQGIVSVFFPLLKPKEAHEKPMDGECAHMGPDADWSGWNFCPICGAPRPTEKVESPVLPENFDDSWSLGSITHTKINQILDYLKAKENK